MRHITHIKESCLAYQWVMTHEWMSQRLMSHISINYVPHINESCHVMSRLVYSCDMTHDYLQYAEHDSLICVTWLNHTCAMTHWYVSVTWGADSFIIWRLIWPIDMIDMCYMTHSYVWLSLLICMTWCANSFICVTCLMIHTHMCVCGRVEYACECACACACVWGGCALSVWRVFLEATHS